MWSRGRSIAARLLLLLLQLQTTTICLGKFAALPMLMESGPATASSILAPGSAGSQSQLPPAQSPSSSLNGGAGNNGDTSDEQLLANGTMRCDDARLRCAYRTGCGRALQHYLTRCASVLHGDVDECPEICQHAIVALMSTDQGKDLTTCACAKEDTLCQRSKQRAEVCRASVTATMNRTRVSCRVATWICNADALCSTALQYYNENCKRMFHGKKCTKRCRNSINILRRQEKAAKLNTCFCDGAEEYDCKAIHRNMDELCFNKPHVQHNYEEQQLGEGSASPGGSADDRRGGLGGHSTNQLPDESGAASRLEQSSTLILGLLLGLALLQRGQALRRE